MNRKRFLFTLMLAVFMSAGLASITHAWQVNEFSYEVAEPESTVVWYQIVNNSAEDIVGFGVGTMDMDLEIYCVEAGAPRSQDGGNIGDWWGYIATKDAWDDDGNDIYGPSGNTTYKDYFGMNWDNAFGDEYLFAYVAVPDYRFFDSFPGFIPAGITYHEIDDGYYTYLNDFGFVYYTSGEPMSPALVMFEQSGAFQGQTGESNTNPVPVPGAIWLFGSGLMGMVMMRRRKSKV